MYRDLIGDPEKIEYNGREWWVQIFCHWDGNIKGVRLFDENGEFVGEFEDQDAAAAYMDGVQA